MFTALNTQDENEAKQKSLRSRRYKIKPATALASACLRAILDRTRTAIETTSPERAAVAGALLGAAPMPELPLSGLMEHSPAIASRRIQRIKCAVDALLARADGVRFRAWCWQRADAGEIVTDTENKDFAYLGAMITALNKIEGRSSENIFQGLKFQEMRARRASFSSGWISKHLLAPGALGGLNEQARDILLMMVNTGARPSELVALTADRINLTSNIPHIEIASSEDRILKTENAERKIPLVGVSLDAARRHLDGFPRYEKAAPWSNAVGKFLRENDLLETDKHSAYSLRHAFQDRLQNVNCSDRTRKELMGHAIEGVVYADGADLANKAEWFAKIVL